MEVNGASNILLRALGDNKALISFYRPEDNIDLLKSDKDWLSLWFESVYKWCDWESNPSREAWVQVIGALLVGRWVIWPFADYPQVQCWGAMGFSFVFLAVWVGRWVWALSFGCFECLATWAIELCITGGFGLFAAAFLEFLFVQLGAFSVEWSGFWPAKPPVIIFMECDLVACSFAIL
ncbi:hypothetical protein U1Q18_035937 [Sarracenia purpurea var. burkii]